MSSVDRKVADKASVQTDQGEGIGQSDLVATLLAENARLQNRLLEQQQRADLYEGVFHSLSDAMLIADKNRVITVCNPAVEAVFGYTSEDLIGNTTAMLYESQSEYEAQGRERFNLSAEEKSKPYSVNYRRKDNEVFIGETVGTPIRCQKDKLLGFLGAIRDVTRREQKTSEVLENEKLLDLIANSLPELVAYVDSTGTMRFVNSTGEQWYNAKKSDLIGRPVAGILGPEATKVVRPLYEAAFAGNTIKERRELTYPDGVHRHVEISYVPDVNADGTVVGMVALVVDVSEQHAVESELRTAKTRFSDAIEAIPDGFAYYDSEDRLQIFNSQYHRIYSSSTDKIAIGYTFEEIIRDGVARGHYPEAIGYEEEWVRSRLATHRSPQGALEQQLADGKWVKIDERRTCDGGIVGVRVDITELKHREEELRRLSVTDHLTGLENRRAFLYHLHETMNSADRHRRLMAVLLIDIDRFKAINDTYGHAAGDEVLKTVAELITAELRGQDRACRYGGEEFAVFLPDTSLGGAYATAERIRQIISAREIACNDATICTSVSIGVAQIDDRDDRYEDALCRADEALYLAKESGRNRVRVKAHAAVTDESDSGTAVA